MGDGGRSLAGTTDTVSKIGVGINDGVCLMASGPLSFDEVDVGCAVPSSSIISNAPCHLWCSNTY